MVDLQKLLEDSGAIRRGHFVLTSGRHSDVYFEKFRVLERPDVLSALCSELIQKFSGLQFDVVAGPTTGGIIIAFEVGRQLGLPALYIETVDGSKQIRRSAKVPQGAKVLLVDDVLTTGTSLVEAASAIREAGGLPVAAGVLIDRSEELSGLELPLESAFRVQAKSYSADALPEWLARIPAEKPGTRGLQ